MQLTLLLVLAVPATVLGYVLPANFASRCAPVLLSKTYLRSSLDYDFPSDVSESTDVRQRSNAPQGDKPELRERIKQEIMVLAATTNRGQLASVSEKESVADLVFQLEALNPTPVTTDSRAIGGTWDLVFSDVQPFRSSPFFMALGTLFNDDRERGETAFALHRAATSNGEIGRVRQIITASELISEVDLRVGLISGIPFSMTGTVVSKAKLQPLSSESFGVTVGGTSIKNNNMLPFLDSAIEVPTEQIYSTLRGGAPEVKWSTYYLDDDFRVSRTPDEHYFIYTRA